MTVPPWSWSLPRRRRTRNGCDNRRPVGADAVSGGPRTPPRCPDDHTERMVPPALGRVDQEASSRQPFLSAARVGISLGFGMAGQTVLHTHLRGNIEAMFVSSGGAVVSGNRIDGGLAFDVQDPASGNQFVANV